MARIHHIPENLMIKCAGCGALLVTKEWERDFKVCAKCGFHARLGARERMTLLSDENSFAEWDANLEPRDPLHFPDYENKRVVAQVKTGLKDSCVIGAATFEGRPVALGASDFAFMGGSMGSVLGEKITRLFERAAEQKRPAIVVTSTGGARMHEGLLSLMQMAKTSAAVGALAKSGRALHLHFERPVHRWRASKFRFARRCDDCRTGRADWLYRRAGD